jgi:hypothetical protein
VLSVIAYASKDEAILIAIDSKYMKSFEMIEIRREGCDLRLGQAGGDWLHDQ